MIQSAFNTNLPGTVIGGVPSMGVPGVPFGAGGLDVDPISPGIQTQPGVLTATGPSRVVGGGMVASGYRGVGSGFGGIGYGGAAGIVGGPGALGGGVVASGYRGVGISGIGATYAGGVGGGIVDADPITPGIQAQPGVVTPTGPPRVVGGPGAVGSALSGVFGGSAIASGMARSGFAGVDADPITPGIQGSPGVVTPIGPTKVVQAGYGSGLYPSQVGYGYRNCVCCPWWLWTLLGLLLLGGLIGGLYSWNTQQREKGLHPSSGGSLHRGSSAGQQQGSSTDNSASANTSESENTGKTDEQSGSSQENKGQDESSTSSGSTNEGSDESSGGSSGSSSSETAAAGGQGRGNWNANRGNRRGGSSGSRESSSFGSNKRLHRKRQSKYSTRTVSKTQYENQVVQPIYTNPLYRYRHLERQY